jgi:ADP-heptose:LPS heptosyltransferase
VEASCCWAARPKAAAEAIVAAVPEALRGRVYVSAQASVQRSAALLRQCRYCVGNDTGVLNMAVANEVPALGLFGVTPPMARSAAASWPTAWRRQRAAVLDASALGAGGP